MTRLQAVDLSCIRQQKKLFDSLSFELSEGELLVIEGENGSGKSSLLRLLVGLSTPANGDVLWMGKRIQDDKLAYVSQMHYVGHSNGLKLGLTVEENLRLLRHCEERFLRRSKPGFDVKVKTWFASSQKALLAMTTPTANLSAGQRRKLALSKLFLHPKKLWILDEPFTALDAGSQQIFLSQLEKHIQQGGMCVMTSHHHIPFQHITPRTLRLSL